MTTDNGVGRIKLVAADVKVVLLQPFLSFFYFSCLVVIVSSFVLEWCVPGKVFRGPLWKSAVLCPPKPMLSVSPLWFQKKWTQRSPALPWTSSADSSVTLWECTSVLWPGIWRVSVIINNRQCASHHHPHGSARGLAAQEYTMTSNNTDNKKSLMFLSLPCCSLFRQCINHQVKKNIQLNQKIKDIKTARSMSAAFSTVISILFHIY